MEKKFIKKLTACQYQMKSAQSILDEAPKSVTLEHIIHGPAEA